MSGEEQIAEMARDLCECYVDYGADRIDVKATAKKLLNKGYRKASDVAAEIFDKVERLLSAYVLARHIHSQGSGQDYFELHLIEDLKDLRRNILKEKEKNE